jgi:hypothetical protein
MVGKSGVNETLERRSATALQDQFDGRKPLGTR